MASCSGIGIKEITSTRVLLKGVITGLDSSKRYCLHHFWGGWENVPRTNGQTYTYITGRTSVDLSSYGCYVPKNKTIEGQQFEVRLNEVVNTCESIIREACTKVLWYEVTEQRYAHFYVRDENGNPIDNARIEVSGETKYTGSNGKTYFILDTGMTYYARGYAPSGYTCTDCNESFYHDSDRVVNFYVEKEIAYCLVDVQVVDQEGTGVAGAVVNIAGAEGADNITTNLQGAAVGFTLITGKNYTMKVSSVPSAWEIISTSTKNFTAQYNQTFTLYVNKKVVHICNNGEKRYPTTCDDGSVIHAEVCENNMWVPTNEKCLDDDVGEVAVIDVFQHPLTLKKGDNVSVDCVIKNTGTETCELVLKLCDGGGTVIDNNPNNLYFTLGVGESVNKNVSTASHPLHNMPDHDITWKIELWEIDLLNPNDLLDSRPIYIEFDELTETISMDELFGTTRAHTNDNVEAILKATNTGNDPCEVVLRLYDDDTGELLDENPDLLVFSIDPGESFEHKVSTVGHIVAMPDRDWNLRFELDEFAHIGASVRGEFQKNHYTKKYTIEWIPDDEVIEGELSINVPSITMAGSILLGGTGIAGKRVFIMAKRSWLGFDKLARDTELGSVIIDADNTYEIEVELDDFGIVDVYAKIKEGPSLENWLGLDLVSPTKTIYVLTWTILIALILGIGLILEKKYNMIGIFK